MKKNQIKNTRKSSKILVLTKILICFCFFVKGQNIVSNTQGFSLSAYGVYTNFNSNSYFLNGISEIDDTGYGGGLEMNYGFTESLQLFLGYYSNNFNLNKEWDGNSLGVFELGGKYNFLGSLNKIRPYLKAGLCYNSLTVFPVVYTDNVGNMINNAQLRSKGPGASASFGLQYFFSPEINVDFSVGGRFGNFTKNFTDGNLLKFEENIDFRYLFAKIGITYNFY